MSSAKCSSSLILDSANAFLFLDRLDLSPIDKATPQTPKLKMHTTSVRGSLKKLCETMSRQILTRAFYGWLAYHRNLKTVGRHLTGKPAFLIQPLATLLVQLCNSFPRPGRARSHRDQQLYVLQREPAVPMSPVPGRCQWQP